MGENKNSDFEIKNNSVENNSNPQVELAISSFRPGSSSSNNRPGLSNSNRPVHFNHWLEGVRDHVKELEIMLNELEITPKKRSHSDNDDWGKDNKLNKRETLDKLKEGNSENDGNERANENSHDTPLMSLQDIALSSQQMVLPMSQLQAVPYPTYGWNASENYHMDHNKEADPANHISSILPMNSRRPASNVMPLAVNNVASTSGIGISYGQGNVPPASVMNGFPDMNIGNSNGSLYGMVPMIPNISSYTPFPVMNNIDPIVPNFNNLEPITIPHAVLTPPLPGERRTGRAKPPGCRTVFVGNLPEKITEEIVKEAFKICGPITVVHMNKKNFCHIRFVNMESVDQALLLSGFRIRIDECEDPAYNGKLHVDYAVARDDQHDYECLERARLREERRRQKEAFRPPSPTPIPHFSEHEARTLTDRLRNEETFREGLQVLFTWLDRRECNKKSSGTFYSLIQSSHSHVKRLRNEKNRYEEEAEKAKENLTNKNRSIGQEINEIEKVFVAAKTQKVWDHFTRSQRKKMEEMKNDTYDLKQTISEDLLENRVEVEIELSDNEENGDMLQIAPAEDLNILREKSDNPAYNGKLHVESAVARDDIYDLKQTNSEDLVENREDEMELSDNEENGDTSQLGPADELNMLQERINSLTIQLDIANQTIEEFKGQCAEHQKENVKLRLELEESKKLEKAGNDSPDCFENHMCFNHSATQYSPSRVDATEDDSQLISLISIFLNVHPFGASIDYICSYLVKIIPTINARNVESLLRRFPYVFREVCTGIGATLEKKWTHIGFGDQN